MSGYMEAVEAQAATRRFFQRSDATELIALAFEGKLHGGEPEAELVRSALVQLLTEATPFYVAPDICTLLERGGDSYPDRAVTRDLMPCEAGWLYLSSPTRVPQTPELLEELRDDHDYQRSSGRLELKQGAPDPFPEIPPLHAALWVGGQDGESVFVYIFGYLPGRPIPCLLWFTNIRYGEHWRKYDADTQGAEVFNAYLRYVVSAWEFMRQRLLTVGARACTPRQARHRLARDFGHEPQVQVVQLRARDYQRKEGGEGSPVEWSCRWLVRGHWRNQWYPASNEHRPIWIVPHEKGDPSKPLVLHDGVAYEVVR